MKRYLILLCFILLTIIFIQNISAQWTGTVYGRILDIHGNGVENVTIQFYNYHNEMVKEIYSDEEGYFSTDISPGAYTVKLRKEGYEKYSQSIFVSADSTIDLGNITLNYSIQIYTPINSIIVKPGDKLSIQLKLRNIGYDVEDIFFTTNASEDWSINLMYSGITVQSISLTPNEEISLTLEINVPLFLGKTCLSLMFNLSSNVVVTKNLTINSVIEEKDILKSTTLYRSAKPGETIYFNIQLYNPLKREMEYNLSIGSTVDWIYRLLRNGEEVNSIIIPGEKTEILKLEIQIPDTAVPGKYYFAVEARNILIKDNVNLMLNVETGRPILSIETSVPSIDVYSGGIANFRLKCSNIGTRDTVVSFKITDLPADFKYFIKDEQGNIISRIFLKAGEYRNIILSVRTPYNINPVLISFKFQIYSENTLDTINLEINVLGKYEIDYVTENYYIETYIGEEVIFELTIKNTGYNELTGIRPILIKSPSDMNVTFDPEILESLKPGETYTFNIIIESSSDMSPGDYYITLYVTTNEIDGDKVSIHVFLKQRTEMTYIGYIVVIGIVILLIILYRKYGRR